MDYIDETDKDELDNITQCIDSYLQINDYENAFVYLFLLIGRLNVTDRDDIILYYNAYIRKKYISKKHNT
jgi:hypothetical protein